MLRSHQENTRKRKTKGMGTEVFQRENGFWAMVRYSDLRTLCSAGDRVKRLRRGGCKGTSRTWTWAPSSAGPGHRKWCWQTLSALQAVKVTCRVQTGQGGSLVSLLWLLHLQAVTHGHVIITCLLLTPLCAFEPLLGCWPPVPLP